MKPFPPTELPSLPVDGEPLQPRHPLHPLPVPSRDKLVRQSSPPDTVGRVFGIVTIGFNFGGMVAPIVGGMLLDHHAPAWIFYGSAAFMLLTVVIAVSVDRSERLRLKV